MQQEIQGRFPARRAGRFIFTGDPMFLYVMTFVAILAAVAFGWISFQSTSERITISLEIAKLRPVFAWLNETASHVRAKGHEFLERSRNS